MTNKELLDNATELEKISDWSSAISAYKLLYKLEPTTLVLSKLVWCYSRNNEFKMAKSECAKLIEKEPCNSKWLYMYGYQFYMEKDWSEAVRYFEKALEFNPNYFVVLYRISYAYIQIAGEFLKLTKAEYWKAIGYLKQSHQVWEILSCEQKELQKNTYYHINFLHGKALMQIQNHNNEAITLFKKALTIKNDVDCKYNLAKALYFAEQYEQAKQTLPDIQKYYVIELSAQIEFKLGNTQKALSLIQQLVERRPKDYLFCFLANIKIELGDFRESYQFAKKAIASNNRNHKNHYTLACAYYQLGLLNKALNSLDIAENLKKQKYNNPYLECDKLREQINLLITPDYIDDATLISSLDNITTSLYKGIVSHYNNEKGYGFVVIDGQRIFVHISKVLCGKLCDGVKIQFKITITDKGKQAVDIEIIK